MSYICKQCSSTVIVEPNKEPVRTCSCKKEDGSPMSIIMDMGESTMIKGTSSFGNAKLELEKIQATPENVEKINKLIEDWINSYKNGI